MIKKKEPLNNFKSLTMLKFIYGYPTIFQVLRVVHLAAKLVLLGLQKVQKVEKCLIEGAIFLKF